MVAWIDFGFNHGDSLYIKPEEFDFTWETSLDENKIHIFTLNKIEEMPIFKYVMNLNDLIMGCLIILPASRCNEFWNLIKISIESLIRVGFIDDDQLLILMAYNENPEIFEVHMSDWFLPLKEFGGEHLTIREKDTKKQKISFIQRMKRFLKQKREIYRYFKRIKNVLNKF